MKAVSFAQNKCAENMLCDASNRKQLVAGTTMKSCDRRDKEMKNDGIIETESTETDGERRTPR